MIEVVIPDATGTILSHHFVYTSEERGGILDATMMVPIPSSGYNV